MKTILIILVVALGGLSYKFQSDVRSAKFLQSIAEDGEKEAEKQARELKSSLASAERTIEELKEQLAATAATAGTSAPRSSGLPDRAPAITSQASPASPASAPGSGPSQVQAKLDQLKAIYDQNKSTIDQQKLALSTNLEKADAIEANLRANPPTFSEQTLRMNNNGLLKNAGVRTSAADRNEAIKKHNDQIAQAVAQAAKIREEIAAVEARANQLEQAYREATDRALAGQ
jgi:uncharacterized coiled-coil protein SlyX